MYIMLQYATCKLVIMDDDFLPQPTCNIGIHVFANNEGCQWFWKCGYILYMSFFSILHTAIVSSLCNEDVTPSNNTLSSTSNHTQSYPGDGFSTVEISAKSHQSNHGDQQKVRMNLLILNQFYGFTSAQRLGRVFEPPWPGIIGHTFEYPIMHYFGNPRHTQSMLAQMFLIE